MTFPAFPAATDANALAEFVSASSEVGIRTAGLNQLSQLQLVAANLLKEAQSVGVYTGVFNVLDPAFKANDDVTSARAALQAAKFVNGTVYLPPRVAPYQYTAGLFSDGFDNVTICGGGMGATTINAEYAGTPSLHSAVMTFQNANNVTIRDLSVTGTHAGAVFYAHGSGAVIERVEVSGATLTNTQGICVGIYGIDLDNALVQYNRCSGNGNAVGEGHSDIAMNAGTYRITNSRILYNTCTSTLVNQQIALFDPYRCLVQGNYVSGAIVSPVTNVRQGYGLLLYRTASQADVTGECQVLSNQVHSVQGAGIYMQQVTQSIVSANWIDDTGSMQSDASLAVGGIAAAAPRLTIIGNYINNSHKSAIALVVADGSIVMGNNCDTSDADGISLRGTMDDITIGKNRVKNAAGVAIGNFLANATWALSNITIEGSTVIGTPTAGISRGIMLGAASSSCSVQNNDCSQVDAGREFLVQGTNMTAKDNIVATGLWPNAMSTNRGDNSVTVTVATDYETQLFNTALTADRTVTLATTNVYNGARFRLLKRNASGAGALNVLTSSIAAGTNGYIDVEYSAALNGWTITGSGTF